MSVLLIDSFDDGLSSQKWTSMSDIGIVSTTPRTGPFCAQFDDGSLDGGSFSRSLPVAQQHATMIAGFGYFAYTNWNGAHICSFMGDSGSIFHNSLYRFSDGSLAVYRGGTNAHVSPSGTLLAQSAPNIILLSNWYHIEIKSVLGDVSGSIEVRVNNTPVIAFSGDTKNGGAGTVYDRFFLGSYSGNPISPDNGDGRVDDFYLLNGAGTSNNNFIGDSRVHALYPDGNGNYSQLIGQDGNSTDNYLNVDETVPDSGTTYNGGGTSGNKDSYAFPSAPAAVTAIRAIAQRAWAAAADAGSRSARQFVRIAGTDYPGTDFNVGATYLHFETLFDVSPATSSAFTLSEFNGAEWGFEVRA